MAVIGPFRGANYCFTSYYRTRLEYTLPTNGFTGTFNTIEHAIQAAKCDTESHAATFLRNYGHDPRIAHKMGASIHPIHASYTTLFVPMLEQLNILKFTGNSELARRLMNTGSDYLVYYNYWHDTTLGVCGCNKCKDVGVNLLGVILMGVRQAVSDFFSQEEDRIPLALPQVPHNDDDWIPF